MALKITISNSQEAVEFFNMVLDSYPVIERRINYLITQRDISTNEALERREYIINREREVVAAEDALNIKTKKVA